MTAAIRSRAGWVEVGRDPSMWTHPTLENAAADHALTGLSVTVMRRDAGFEGSLEFLDYATEASFQAQSASYPTLAEAQEWCEVILPRLIAAVEAARDAVPVPPYETLTAPAPAETAGAAL